MTVSDEFNSTQTDVDFDEVGSGYPTAFGITFTPQITGLILGALGLLGSIYVVFNFVMPAHKSYQSLKADEVAKQSQVKQQESGELSQKMLETEAKLRESEALRNQVLALFSSEDSLKTMLFDINQLVEKHRLQLISFKPNGSVTVVTDGSLGTGVNNRLKRQRFGLTIEGNFESTQSLLRDLERLQPLLVITGLDSKLVEDKFLINVKDSEEVGEETTITGNNSLKTRFTLDAILPLSPEELAKLSPEEEGEEAK
ncbi:MAG: pilus assembly protein [Crocosphaera sp.]|nr:pilus assembly protein [Crocosphaera sp.]